MNKLKTLKIHQYVLFAGYILIVLFASLGTLTIDLSDVIVYVKEPTGGFPQPEVISLNFGIFGKILLSGIAVAELIMMHFENIKLATVNIVLSVIRMIYPILYMFLRVLAWFFNDEFFTVEITAFADLLLIVCVASLILHCLMRKALKKERDLQITQY